MFNSLFTIVPIITICMFVFFMIFMFSPKLRGKFMSKQIDAAKHMVDESKDSLSEITKTMSKMAIKKKKTILEENEDLLKETSRREAEIEKEKIEILAKAIKDGLTDKDNSK